MILTVTWRILPLIHFLSLGNKEVEDTVNRVSSFRSAAGGKG